MYTGIAAQWDLGAESPHEIARTTGLPVQAVIDYTAGWQYAVHKWLYADDKELPEEIDTSCAAVTALRTIATEPQSDAYWVGAADGLEAEFGTPQGTIA